MIPTWGSNSPWPKQTTRLRAWWKKHTAIKAKAIKSLKWKEEEEEVEESNQCRSRRCAKKAKILQAGKKRGRGSLQTGRGGGEWHVTVGTAFAAMKSSSIYVCGCESKAKEGTDGCGDSSSGYKCLAAVVAAEKACPWPFARFAFLGCSPVPTPKSRLTSVHNSPFLFDLILFLFLTGEIYKMNFFWKMK